MTPRFIIEKRTRRRDRRLEDLVGNMHLVAIALDADANLTYCNDYFLRLTGWTLPEVLGCNWFDRFVPKDINDLQQVSSDVLKDLPDAWHHENEILCQSGKTILIRWNNSAVRNSSNHVIGVACIGEDITERRGLECELLEAGTRERRHLAAELHDGLGQSLYGASLLAKSLETSAQKAGFPIVHELSQLAGIIGASIETCRCIAHGISPLAVVPGGIVDALRNLTHMSTNAGAKIELTIAKAAPLRIDSVKIDHLYRLAQEALSNALKHASATLILVQLDIQPTRVTLTIVDDGIGLPAQPTPLNGFGLRLMHYRAEIIHAILTITRVDPHGTRICVEISQPDARNYAGQQSAPISATKISAE